MTVSGTVTDGAQPIAAVAVEFFDSMHVLRANTSTDMLGVYSVQVPPGVYDIHVTPPAGTGLAASVLAGRSLLADTTVDVVLVPATAVVLSGRVADALGAGIANAWVELWPQLPGAMSVSTQTDATGAYRFEVPLGTYRLSMRAWMPDLDAYRPQNAQINVWSVPLETDRVLDLRIPSHRVQIHVEDATGAAVSNTELRIEGIENCEFLFDGLPGCISSSYWPSPLPMPGMPAYPPVATDANGNFVAWLVPTASMGTPMSGGYTITATPPAALGLPQTIVRDVAVRGDTSVTLVLQGAMTLSGRLLDGGGVGIAGAWLDLWPQLPGAMGVSTQTDATGAYRFDVPRGTYRLSARASNPELEPGRPQNAQVNIWSVPLEANRVLDLRIPSHRVQIQVRDAAGAAVPNVTLRMEGIDNCEFIFDGLPGCVSSSYWPPPPPMPGMPVNPPVETDADGNFTAWLVPSPSMGTPMGNGYSITATPPAASGLPATIVRDVAVHGDTTVTIVLQGAVTLAGRLLDGAGVGIANAWVELWPTLPGAMGVSTQTDANGAYRFEVPRGTYRLSARAWMPQLDPKRPQNTYVNVWSVSLEADRVLDLRVPAHPVQIHVQDVTGAPVAGISLSIQGIDNCEFVFDGLPGCVSSSYWPTPPPMPGMPTYPPVATDADGNFTAWLVPSPSLGTPMGAGYTITATPQAEMPFRQFVVRDQRVAGPSQVLIVLQFVHESPVSTAALSPLPGANGEYPDPVTVTVSSVAAPGFAIARIEYQVDGGPIATYTGPFTVAGGGPHEVRFRATDTGGVYEAPKSVTFTIRAIPTLAEIGDTLAAFCASGEVDDPGICNSLAVKLRDGAPLHAFLAELDAQRGKHVSETAYARLADDVRKYLE